MHFYEHFCIEAVTRGAPLQGVRLKHVFSRVFCNGIVFFMCFLQWNRIFSCIFTHFLLEHVFSRIFTCFRLKMCTWAAKGRKCQKSSFWSNISWVILTSDIFEKFAASSAVTTQMQFKGLKHVFSPVFCDGIVFFMRFLYWNRIFCVFSRIFCSNTCFYVFSRVLV